MTHTSSWYQPKRAGAFIVLEVFLLQAISPAFAASTGYSGVISQLPAAYVTPPLPNVMFTLDDSLSMNSDAIPDFLTDGGTVDLSGMPEDDDSNAIPTISGAARQFPNMWGANSEYLDINYYSNLGDTAAHRVGRYMRSSDGNPLYYNPKARYRPWPLPSNDKSFHPNANPAAVNIHPTDPFNTGRKINLTQRLGPSGSRFWPATYMVKTSAAALPAASPNSTASTAATFTKVEIQPTVLSYNTPKPADRTDCVALPDACSYTEELQNFANWLQYYRSRALMAKGGVAAAFARQATNLRVGFGTINNPASFGVRDFSAGNRTAFYNQIYPVTGSPSGTPLRAAMDSVGKYFQRSNAGNPWAENPLSGSVGTEYSCRRSFHILSTDGFWNGNGATDPGDDNNDNFAGQTTPNNADGSTGFAYSNAIGSKWGIFPFADGAQNTLADVAAYYWKTDLRPTSGMPNNVAGTPRDPAYWQHLSTFTVGLGINGTGTVRRRSDNSTTVPTGLAAGHPLKAHEGKPWLSESAIREWLVANRVEMIWPTPTSGAKTTGDDLVHAAMNGRGRYFSATNPSELANNLASALAEAGDNPGDVASVAADAPQVRAGGRVYQATFSPARWYGRLYAFNQSVSTGEVNNTPTDATTTNPDQAWEASNKMPTPINRNIFTSSGSTGSGATFTWNTGGLTATQKAALGGDSKVLDYLRGDGTFEVANGGSFRDRSRYTVAGVTGGVLGDVVNGSPVKGPDAGGGYERLPTSDGAQALYAAFRAGNGLDNMRNTMFLGANDGMLHGFDLADGVERFAYVPSSVYNVRTSVSGSENKLQLLATDLTGTHRFTVDGPPNLSDAFIGGAWKTVLTAATGAGARSVFAIDVTNPSVAAGFGTGKIMWEFTDANNSDMGHVPAYPHVARMPTGDWVVIFGNGYDSTNGQAKLFILKLSDGSVLREIPVGTAGNNGLGQPNMLLNSNREVIAIYAGDLRGNLWKFDTSSASDAANWGVALGGAPLVTVKGPTGTLQPITVMPEITEHPDGGALLSFGTGKLFETTDTAVDSTNVNLNTQSIYGIWDKNGETTGITLDTTNRTSLLQVQNAPTFSATATFAATSASAPAYNSGKRGWAIDLASGGERVNLAAQQVKSVLFVVANTPNPADPCGAGGSAKVFVIDPVKGIRPAFAVFDVDGNKVFNATDKDLNVRIVRNGLLTQPIFQVPAQASGAVPTGVTTTPLSLFDRGQVTAARTGGVELARSKGGVLDVPNPCSLLITAARSDTEIETSDTQVCDPTAATSGKARISWRQLQ